MITVILCMAKKYGEQLSHTFLSNYPNYTIHFTISKGLPVKSSENRKTFWICDRDSDIEYLLSLSKHKSSHPEYSAQSQYPAPIIAFSHEGNSDEHLMAAPWLLLSPDSLTPELLEEIYCRCNGLPMTITETSRLTLRELSRKNLPDLLSLQAENKKNPDGCFFPEGCSAPDSFLDHYIDHQYSFYGFGLFGMFRRSDDCFLGIAGFSQPQSSELEICISYALLQQYQGQGYALEAITALLELAPERWGFSHIGAEIHEENLPSLHLAFRAGIPVIRL